MLAAAMFPFALDAVERYVNVTPTMPVVPLPLGQRSLMRPEFLEVLDCSYDSGWDRFRRQLTALHAGQGPPGGLEAARANQELRDLAIELTEQYRSSDMKGMFADIVSFTSAYRSVVSGETTPAEAGYIERRFCHYGLLVVEHLWWGELLPVGNPAYGPPFARILLGKFRSLDFLSSSSWPLTYLDVLLASGDPTGTQGMTVPWSASRHLTENPHADWRPPILRRAIDPQGCTCAFRRSTTPCWPPAPLAPRGHRPSKPISVAVPMAHISLTMDLASALLHAHGGVTITMMCDDSSEGMEDNNVHQGSCARMCKLEPSFCALPKVSQVMDWDGVRRVRHEADLHLCFDYVLCERTVNETGKPFILYDGTQYGHQMMMKNHGFEPDWSHVDALRRLLARDVYVVQRARSGALLPHEVLPEGYGQGPPGVVFTTNPWQAEAIFFQTGLRAPSVRPGNLYLKCRHDPARSSGEVFIHHDRGRCLVCNVFAGILQRAVAKSYPLKLVHTPDYLSFCDIARFRALVLVPHGNVMQMFFREAVNMALPTYVPDRTFLVKQPFLWFFERMEHNIGSDAKLILGNPPRPPGFAEPHVGSPYVLKYPAGPERFEVILYWMQFLDYFHWPGVRHFTSVPDLLFALVQDDTAASSAAMRHFVTRQRRFVATFWRDALVRLLPGESSPSRWGGPNETV